MLCFGFFGGVVVFDYFLGWVILCVMKGMICNFLVLFVFLVLVLLVEGQYYDVEECLQEYLVNCDVGDKWVCGYVIFLWM